MLFQLTMTLILILFSQLFPFVSQLFLIFLICIGLESDLLFPAVHLSLLRKPNRDLVWLKHCLSVPLTCQCGPWQSFAWVSQWFQVLPGHGWG